MQGQACVSAERCGRQRTARLSAWTSRSILNATGLLQGCVPKERLFPAVSKRAKFGSRIVAHGEWSASRSDAYSKSHGSRLLSQARMGTLVTKVIAWSRRPYNVRQVESKNGFYIQIERCICPVFKGSGQRSLSRWSTGPVKRYDTRKWGGIVGTLLEGSRQLLPALD